MFVVALIIIFWLGTILEIIWFLFTKISVLRIPHIFEGVFIVLGMLLVQVLKNIYITNERYKLIISANYKPFLASSNRGVAICILALVVGLLLFFGTAYYMNVLSIQR